MQKITQVKTTLEKKVKKVTKEYIGFPKESFSIDIVCKSEDGDDGQLGLISQLGGELDSLINGLLFVMTTNEKAAIMVLTAAYKYKLIKNE